MKRVLLIMFFIMGAVGNGFSINNENEDIDFMLSLGVEWGNFWESYTESGIRMESTYKSPGIIISSWIFGDESNIGFFLYDSFLFPTTVTVEVGGFVADVSYDSYTQIGLTTGVAFRYAFNDDLFFIGGIGPNFLMMIGDFKYSVNLSNDIGIGGALGLEYKFTDLFYLSFSTNFCYSFISYLTVFTSNDSESDFLKSYALFKLNPSIQIGLNL